MLPDCLFARAATTPMPVRCLAHKGITIGGGHSTPEHCTQCLAVGRATEITDNKNRAVCLHFNLAPGDVVTLTAAVRDLKAVRPDYRIFVESPYPEIWAYSPHAKHAGGVIQAYPDAEHFRIDYGQGIHGAHGQKYRCVHFLRWLAEDASERLGVPIPTLRPHGDLHFGPEEAPRITQERYWVVAPGHKSDMPVKAWDDYRYQQVVDLLRAQGLTVVQVGASGVKGNPPVESRNPKLAGVVDMVGQTSLRQLFRLIRDADGVICANSLAMHATAALERPCVVLAGGREAWWWAAYVNENRGFGGDASGTFRVPHRFLHTIGSLDCVEHQGGCWKRHVDPGATSQKCFAIVDGTTGPLAKCQAMITVEHVLEAIMSYYRDGTLPPIGKPRLLADILAEMPVATATTAASLPVIPWAPPAHDPAFDNPVIGGKFTLFLLLYGDFPAMHRRVLDSLMATTTPERVEIRLGSNQLGEESLRLVRQWFDEGRIAVHHSRATNDRKYPVMRAMFHESAFPITTPYLIWLDDDTLCDRDPDWLRKLAEAITREHPNGARLFGPHYRWSLSPEQAAWVKAAPWYLGRPFQDMSGQDTPNGNKIHFASGSFWALATDVMRAQDIPDNRLGHNGGDYTIGEQVHQGGWKLHGFSTDKSVVQWSAFPRRGLTEPHPGLVT